MKLFNPNTDNIKDYYEKGKFLLAWRLMLLFGAAFLILSLVFLNSSLEEAIVYGVCLIIAITSLIYLHYTKESKWFYIGLSVVGVLIAFYTLNYFDKILHIGDFLWLTLIVTFTFFGLGKKVGLVFLLLAIFNVSYYIIHSVNDNIENLKILSNTEKAGLIIEISIALICITYVINQFVIFHNYTYNELKNANTDLKNQNNIISTQNHEKTTLVQEIHHRVKNNLQIIISLLRLQSNEIKSPEAKKSLSEAVNRIMVMSLIHQKLYGTKSLSNIDLKEYLTELISDISKVYSDKKIKIDINTNYNVGLKTIVPLGLLFNELVTNSYKHAFKNVSNGEISITVKQKLEKDFEVYYSDNGNWIEPTKTNFGLELIDIMTSQLDGHLERVIENNKTTFIFFIKDIDEPDNRTIKEQLN